MEFNLGFSLTPAECERVKQIVWRELCRRNEEVKTITVFCRNMGADGALIQHPSMKKEDIESIRQVVLKELSR